MVALLEFNKKFTFPEIVLLAKKSAVLLLLLLFPEAKDLDDGRDLIVEEEDLFKLELKESKWSSVSWTGLWVGVNEETIPCCFWASSAALIPTVSGINSTFNSVF